MIALAAVDEDISSEDKPKRQRYISKKDLIGAGLVVLLVVPLVLFFYGQGKGSADDAYCRQNLHQIGAALLNYSQANDGLLPPTHNMDEEKAPAIEPQSGLTVTWATNVQPFMSSRNDFWCRTAKKEEGMQTLAGKAGQKHLDLSYGMYRGLASTPIIKITSPGETFVIAETTNNGASSSFDPKPFGPSVPDGFLIGWDDGNIDFTNRTKFVTRLAFSKSESGYSANSVGRHGKRINAITVEGNYRPITPDMTRVEHARPRLKGDWWADPNLYK